MSCAGCSTSGGGCGKTGGCSSGGCNRMNTYDWLSDMDIADVDGFDIVEVSFKNGSSKEFYHNTCRANTHDWVAVDTGTGYDVGQISLSGELVRLQMKKKRIKETAPFNKVVRIANVRDEEKMQEARVLEPSTLIRARAIARSLGLDMKIGDIQYQADLRKATFYYTAEGRVDFRELIRHYAKEFRVKIEMRQIGARQESARIGGLGSCGRELCCSTWLSNFKSVNTAAARYQNLAINQAKLSGQCGRLKCCLNYELDTYLEALEAFPEKAERLKLANGHAFLIKTDVFKGLLFYMVEQDQNRGKIVGLTIAQVKELQVKIAKGDLPRELIDLQAQYAQEIRDKEVDFENVNEVIDLPMEDRRKKKSKKKRSPRDNNSPRNSTDGKPREERKPREDRLARDNSPKDSSDTKPREDGKPRDNRKPRAERPPRDNKPRDTDATQKEPNANTAATQGEKDGNTEPRSRSNNRNKKRSNRGPRNKTSSNEGSGTNEGLTPNEPTSGDEAPKKQSNNQRRNRGRGRGPRPEQPPKE